MVVTTNTCFTAAGARHPLGSVTTAPAFGGPRSWLPGCWAGSLLIGMLCFVEPSSAVENDSTVAIASSPEGSGNAPNSPNAMLQRARAHGIEPALIYDSAVFSNISGGVKRAPTYLDNLHLQLGIDAGKLAGADGLQFFVDVLRIHGGHPSTLVGDAQGVSNIEGPSLWTLEEAWVQQDLFAGHFSVLAGRYDLNREFYSLQSSALFLNSSFGIGPEFSQSGLQGPSIFPYTALGARFAFKPTPDIVVRTAVLDGRPVNRPGSATPVLSSRDGLLLVGEGAYLWRQSHAPTSRGTRFLIGRRSGESPYESKVAVGIWHYTTRLDDLSETTASGAPQRHHGSTGFYTLADQLLYADAADPSRRVSAFAQLGSGDARVNRFGSYLGFGVTAAGLIRSRPNDQFGVAVASARNGSHYLARQRMASIPTSNVETTTEFTYLAQITPWLALQPDLQFVRHPDTDPSIRNAWTASLRFELAF